MIVKLYEDSDQEAATLWNKGISLETASELVKTKHEENLAREREERIKRSLERREKRILAFNCGKPQQSLVDKPKISDRMAPQISDRMASYNIYHKIINTVGNSESVDNHPKWRVTTTYQPQIDNQLTNALVEFLNDCKTKGIETPRRYDHLTERLAA